MWASYLAQLDALLRQRRLRGPLTWDGALGWSWAESTLVTYRQHIRSVHAFALAQPQVPDPRGVVQAFLLQRLAGGSPAASLRGTLSALQMLRTLGWLPWDVPAPWWRLSLGAARLAPQPSRPRTWFPPGALLELATNASDLDDLCVLAVVFLALALGLRFSEACAVSHLCCLGQPLPTSLHFQCVKVRPGHPQTCTRRLARFPSAWAGFLRSHCPGGSACVACAPAAAMQRRYPLLLRGTSAAGMSFHSIRRACAQLLHVMGHGIPFIAEWCRWASLDTARHYIGTVSGDPLPAFVLPWPPFHAQPAGPYTFPLSSGTFADIFPDAQPTIPATHAGHGRRKRGRTGPPDHHS